MKVNFWQIIGTLLIIIGIIGMLWHRGYFG